MEFYSYNKNFLHIIIKTNSKEENKYIHKIKIIFYLPNDIFYNIIIENTKSEYNDLVIFNYGGKTIHENMTTRKISNIYGSHFYICKNKYKLTIKEIIEITKRSKPFVTSNLEDFEQNLIKLKTQKNSFVINIKWLFYEAINFIKSKQTSYEKLEKH